MLPTLDQQQEFFRKNFISTFTESQFTEFSALAEAFSTGKLTSEMQAHKVQLLPVYEKIAIDRDKTFVEVKIADIYNPKFD